jgi:hypothetical protein
MWTGRPSQNLDWKWLGRFTVNRRVSPYSYQLELPAPIHLNQGQPGYLLDLIAGDPMVGPRIVPPSSEEIDGEETQQLSSVEDSQV